ncbi:glutaminyl-tRNA synthetase [Haloarcula marismortui ATCC 43049]|uniref:Glutamate--tRNA ligase n=2 Tax=Haloarcula marismortui (strain ATCC 43049 / DSM 3752 / JCM 8966 / VKM B-1809) TaxID=272569 RepID=SYE_HALMA|nr:glutamate--tRNA ligase [Haloarcula marismortui]Q5V5N9.1 RecName: Full=Glutamate--tRNA ligase; AltName: Full=Glutamyl-tRNA synthetase; Short=GluRS [Haloarcula marismortui ATCC 43049]AAV45163.1 glutaminyl-tRNA synthetase [Haloarcula marismortui ATCC 43049]QCP92948.1 glutamate--tRNA ligase [Haloarcula marismortui ATCC 43049]
MDDELRDRITEAAETNALLNAVKHDSEAQVGAIMGPLMGENPEFREYGDEIPGVIAPVVERVNGMDAEERRERLAELAPEKLEELEAEDEGEDHPLPDLPSAEEYDTVRMRVAPNPNGPWHIGHARMAAVVGTYKQRYDGEFICRFDDTDPETKRPDLDAYDAILDAIDYLGFEPDDVVNASDRVETYYEYARKLIDKGGAYTCSCPQGEFSDLKNNGEACPHRDKDAETTRSEFEAMVDGEYDSGEMVLRVRTDITHKNPALRDFVAFRMVDTPHPREAAEQYRCWPMLDFQSGLDDHLLGVTHIIRGIDLQDSAKRQQFVYDYFDWEYPEVIHWGHVQVDEYDVPLSTSSIAELIEDGELAGWDDPRAPTVASLERRGIRGEAVVDAMIQLGTSTSNVDLAMSSIYSNNRDLIDDDSDRAFFVRDSDDHGGLVERQIVGGPDAGEPPLHPDYEERGRREIPVTSGVVVEGDDLPDHGDRIWLKGYGCVRHTRDAFEYTGDDIDAVREEGVDVIHWAPADGPALRLRTMDGDVSGVAEPGLRNYDTDDVVQFERIGFARLDKVADDSDTESVAYFTHP